MPTRRRVSPAERRAHAAEIDNPEIVLAAALRFLEARQRSTAEVRRRLGTAGYREDLVAGAIERLTELGMLDDAAFAQAWIESRDRARPRGERALSDELRIKGIDREIVATALEDRRAGAEILADGGPDDAPSADEAAAARLMARNRRSLGRIADPRVRRQRAYTILARNGFSPDVCARVARSLDGQGEDVPDV
jgi:regulatory protein